VTGLTGKHIVITRAWHQASEFSSRLEAHKAIPLFYPCVDIVPPPGTHELDLKITALFAGTFDWLILTSQNAVLALASRMKELRIKQPLPARLKFAAIGTATAAAAQDFLGINARAVPQVYNSQSLSSLLGSCGGQKMLLPQADIARPELAENLQKAGAIVETVVAYQTKKGHGGVRLVDYLRRKQVDVVTFASPSAVRYFKERLQDEGAGIETLNDTCVACIGNVTHKAAVDAGFNVKLVAKRHTVDSLISTLSEHFSA
jgi:uroporphyrinogen-III synthase